MKDLLFRWETGVFSYRVAGICVKNGAVLLQKPEDDPGYAVPGGHPKFGETAAEALTREFREEMGAEITVGRLLSAGELFFPWGALCHQVCLYFAVDEIKEISMEGSFTGREESTMHYCWVPLDRLREIPVYPENLPELLTGGTEYFIYREP